MSAMKINESQEIVELLQHNYYKAEIGFIYSFSFCIALYSIRKKL